MSLRKKRFLMAVPGMMVILIMISCLTASAEPDKAGWETSGKQTFYYVSTETGLIRAVGLQQIGDAYYYFAANGEMSTGWVLTADGYRYFAPDGAVGTKGRMFTGLHKISGRRYHFNELGVLSTGFLQLKNGAYFFTKSGKAGVIGAAVTGKWVRCSGARRYFGNDGKMVTNAWIGDYYVGADGARLTSAITPDGYVLGKNGKKTGRVTSSGWTKTGGRYYYYNANSKKLVRKRFLNIGGDTYYLDENGVRTKGWKTIGSFQYYFNSRGIRQSGKVTIKGKTYYFNSRGRLQISKTVDGYTTDENGVIISEEEVTGSKAKVLIVAGHGQGDVGAQSSLGQEYLYTRKFAKLIFEKLTAGGKVDASYYMNGSTGYDLYQRNRDTLGSLTASITGTGGAKTRVKSALKGNSSVPDLWDYDYVLEVHFNATASASKDEKGNGVCKGFGIYVNSHKPAKQRKIDTKIVANMRKTGSVIWGGGVVTSGSLLNARVCNELGVNYSLIETAFIDDKDDMKFYKARKDDMAAAIAAAIESYLS